MKAELSLIQATAEAMALERAIETHIQAASEASAARRLRSTERRKVPHSLFLSLLQEVKLEYYMHSPFFFGQTMVTTIRVHTGRMMQKARKRLLLQAAEGPLLT